MSRYLILGRWNFIVVRSLHATLARKIRANSGYTAVGTFALVVRGTAVLWIRRGGRLVSP
jgi:hypothetical protein